MNPEELARALGGRSDPASKAATECLGSGARWSAGVEQAQVASERDRWAKPDPFNPRIEVVGREEFLAALAATPHRILEVAHLHSTPRSDLANFYIYLVPGTDEIVACLGVIAHPAPPPRLYEREKIPDTIAGAVEAFGSQEYEVTVHRKLTQAEVAPITDLVKRSGGAIFKNASSVTTLAAAAVTAQSEAHWPGKHYEGYLLILDRLGPSPVAPGEVTAAVEARIMGETAWGLRRVANISWHYEAPAAPGT